MIELSLKVCSAVSGGYYWEKQERLEEALANKHYILGYLRTIPDFDKRFEALTLAHDDTGQTVMTVVVAPNANHTRTRYHFSLPALTGLF